MARWVWSLSLASLAALASGALFAAPAPVPIEWVQHNLIVDLRDLPRRYSCADLWYRFRDVLLAVGAKPSMQIVPNRCESVLGSGARSPHVHLKFEVARQPNPREGSVPAEMKNVQFAAGRPQSLDGGDCELLRQIKGTLFESLDMRATDFRLDCGAQSVAPASWHLTVKVFAPDVDRRLHAGLPATRR